MKALVLLCLTLILITGCAVNLDPSDEKIVYCINDQYSVFSEVVSQILPDYAVERAGNNAFGHLEKGAVSEAFAAQAYAALETGLAKNWYPQYLATVVIAVDRDQTDAIINSWSDLPGSGEVVGHIMTPHLNNEMTLAAMSYGLEGDLFTLKKAGKMLGTLNAEKRYGRNKYEAPILICYDYYVAKLIKDGRNLEIIVPSEGTLSYEKGLLSNIELSFDGDVDSILLSKGFRLLDGRSDNTFYPDAKAYESAAKVTDYNYLNTVVLDATLVFRRDIFRERIYSSADGREHQYFVLIYMVIVVIWIASLVDRSAQKSVKNCMFMAGVLLLGWIILRLLNYQLDVTTKLRRHLWYGYYLFQLFLPLVFLRLAVIIDKTGNTASMPKWFRIAVLINSLIVILVLTNDLHLLTFPMDLSSPTYHRDYGFGIGYYLIVTGTFLPVVAAIILLFTKGKGNIRKIGLIFPVFFVALLALYTYGYNSKIPIFYDSDRTMIIGVFILLFAESLIRTGMIPLNTKYRTLFAHSPLGMQIINQSGNSVLASGSTIKYDKSMFDSGLKSFPQPSLYNENTLIYTAKITGGYGLWQKDIGSLNRLHMEIKNAVEKLKLANSMLIEEEKIKRSVLEESEKTQLMEQLEKEISGHIGKLSDIIKNIENSEEEQKATIRVLLMLCYIKRRCSLFFREKEAAVISPDELKHYFDELANSPEYEGNKIIITSDLRKPVQVRYATLFYDIFYNFMDWTLGLDYPNIHAHLQTKGEIMFLGLVSSADVRNFHIDVALHEAIIQAKGEYAIVDLDGNLGIRLTFTGSNEND